MPRPTEPSRERYQNARDQNLGIWEQRLSYGTGQACITMATGTLFTSKTRWRMCPSLWSIGPFSKRASPFPSPWPDLRLISVYQLWIHSIAKQHNLRLLYKCECHHIYLEERAHPEYGPLLRRMRVVDEREGARWTKISGMRLVRLFPFCLLR